MKYFPITVISISLLTAALGGLPEANAAPVIRAASGDSPAAIQGGVDQFRADLGGVNNGAGGGPFASGFRAVNWDGVPDGFSAPNLFPGDFFNSTSQRGIEFTTPGTGFQVSADSDNPSMTPVRYGNINPAYPSMFQTFSSERLFTAVESSILDVTFFVPSMPSVPAYVIGFGAVFAGVDLPDSTSLEFFDLTDNSLTTVFVPSGTSGGLSFLGVSFDGGEQIGRVRITSGNSALGPGIVDGGGVDLVVMDDFVFGEPQAVPEPRAALLVLGAVLALLALRPGRPQSR